MDPCLVVSPHLDDAALGAGQFVASWPGATVLTVFAGLPPAGIIAPFDAHSNFVSSQQAVMARWHEDDRAMEVLGARPLRAAHLDHQYRTMLDMPDPDVADLGDLIVRVSLALDALQIVGPLGLAHPDHLLTAAAMRVVASRRGECRVYLYEDIPARVEQPEIVADALTVAGVGVRERGRLTHLGTGPLATKERAVGCYRSQAWALNSRHLYVPERFWRIPA